MAYFDAFEDDVELLASVTLESTYGAARSGWIDVSKKSHVQLDIAYTTGASEAANTIEVKIEYSPDGTNYYRKTNEARSTGTTTLTKEEYTFTQVAAAETADNFTIELKDVCAKSIKVWAKESGVGANKGTCVITVTKGGK